LALITWFLSACLNCTILRGGRWEPRLCKVTANFSEVVGGRLAFLAFDHVVLLPHAMLPIRLRFKNNYFTEMCSSSEEGSYLRRIDICITQL